MAEDVGDNKDNKDFKSKNGDNESTELDSSDALTHGLPEAKFSKIEMGADSSKKKDSQWQARGLQILLRPKGGFVKLRISIVLFSILGVSTLVACGDAQNKPRLSRSPADGPEIKVDPNKPKECANPTVLDDPSLPPARSAMDLPAGKFRLKSVRHFATYEAYGSVLGSAYRKDQGEVFQANIECDSLRSHSEFIELIGRTATIKMPLELEPRSVNSNSLDVLQLSISISHSTAEKIETAKTRSQPNEVWNGVPSPDRVELPPNPLQDYSGYSHDALKNNRTIAFTIRYFAMPSGEIEVRNKIEFSDGAVNFEKWTYEPIH